MDYHGKTKKWLIDELKKTQKQCAILASSKCIERLQEENRQLTRDLIMERKKSAEFKALISDEIMNDIVNANIPVPFSVTGKQVEYVDV